MPVATATSVDDDHLESDGPSSVPVSIPHSSSSSSSVLPSPTPWFVSPSSTFCSSSRRWQFQWLAFFLLGTLNNLSYVVVNSAAKSIADSFHSGQFMPAIVWANVALGIGVRFLNTFYLLATPYNMRIIACVLLCLGGSIGLALGTLVSFWMCLAAVVLVGCFSSLGESVILGLLKDFHPLAMGAWSSGTGMAGVAGTLIYLMLFSVIGMSNRVIFLLQAPLAVLYWLAYRYIMRGHPGATSSPALMSHTTLKDGSSTSDEPLSTSPELDECEGEGEVKRPASSLSSSSLRRGRSNSGYILQDNDSDSMDGASTVASPSNTDGLSSRYTPNSPHRHTFSNGKVINANGESQSHGPSVSPATALLDRSRHAERSDHGSGELQSHMLKTESDHMHDSVDAFVDSDGMTDTPMILVKDSDTDHDIYPVETSSQRFKRVFRAIRSPALQLMLVYFFEYMVSAPFASIANPHADPHDWWATNGYELLAFAYQIGVLIARSSVSVIQIERIELLTLAQCAHFILWFIHAAHPFMPLWLQLTDMIVVGLLGGAMYVNVFYLLVKSTSLSKRDQELGINLTAIGINCGIVLSSVLGLILFNTCMEANTDD